MNPLLPYVLVLRWLPIPRLANLFSPLPGEGGLASDYSKSFAKVFASLSGPYLDETPVWPLASV